MNTTLHLVLAAALIASALLVTMMELTLRRRMRNFRSLQLFVYACAAVLGSGNVASLAPGEPHQLQLWIIAGSIAALITQIAMLLTSLTPAQAKVPTRRILAVGAHPDDLELACGGTLARLADSGHEVHALIMSPGAVGGNAAVRPDEAQRGAKYLGLSSCTVLGLPDTRLSECDADMVSAIETRIKELNPDLIFTHSAHDQHQDHSAVHWATRRAGRHHPAILCYESPSVTAEFSPQIFVDVADYVETKAAAVAMHDDQAGKPYMAAGVLQGQSSFRGRQARMEHAEGFEAIRICAFEGVL